MIYKPLIKCFGFNFCFNIPSVAQSRWVKPVSCGKLLFTTRSCKYQTLQYHSEESRAAQPEYIYTNTQSFSLNFAVPLITPTLKSRV